MPLPILLGDEDTTVAPGSAANVLIQRVRRFMGDWPDDDYLTASASTSTTLTVADSSLYSVGWTIQVDDEAMTVMGIPTGTTLTVRRAVKGTTLTSHDTLTSVLLRPHFLNQEYLDALNAGINATFPLLYQPFEDESTVTDPTTYEYTIPNMNGLPIPWISKVFVKITGDLTFREMNDWSVIRGNTPRIKLRRPVGDGLMRIYGLGPLPQLTSSSASLSGLFPTNAEDVLTMYAAQYLMASGEARRVREDTGARDDRENANRAGASMAASQQVLQRFYARLQQSAMPPPPKTIQSVI